MLCVSGGAVEEALWGLPRSRVRLQADLAAVGGQIRFLVQGLLARTARKHVEACVRFRSRSMARLGNEEVDTASTGDVGHVLHETVQETTNVYRQK